MRSLISHLKVIIVVIALCAINAAAATNFNLVVDRYGNIVVPTNNAGPIYSRYLAGSNIAAGTLPLLSLQTTNGPETNLFLRGDGRWAEPTVTVSISSNDVVTALGFNPSNGSNITAYTLPLTAIGAAGVPGSNTFLRGDGNWAEPSSAAVGVSSFNSLTGAVTLVIGAGLRVTTNGNTLTVTTNGVVSGVGDVTLAGTNTFTGPNNFNGSILNKSGAPIATLADIYEIAFGGLSNLRPTNTALPSLSGDITTGSTVALSFGTFFSVTSSALVTNQCGVWVDDHAGGFWGQRGGSTNFVLSPPITTGSVLYVIGTMSNRFGWGSATSPGFTVTNAVEHWRIKAFTSGPDVHVDAGGSDYTDEDVLTIVDGSERTAAQIGVHVDENGAVISTYVLVTAGDYPARLPNGSYATSGGTGSNATIFISGSIYTGVNNGAWELFTP